MQNLPSSHYSLGYTAQWKHPHQSAHSYTQPQWSKQVSTYSARFILIFSVAPSLMDALQLAWFPTIAWIGVITAFIGATLRLNDHRHQRSTCILNSQPNRLHDGRLRRSSRRSGLHQVGSQASSTWSATPSSKASDSSLQEASSTHWAHETCA